MAADTPGRALPTAPGEQSRIHNIGYRHYDGERLGRSYALRSLFSQSLRGAYGLGRSAKSKVLPMLLLGVMCAPALIIVAVAVTGGMDELPVDYRAYAIVMQAVIALYLASQAPQAVSLDLRFKTVPLYFSRPIETSDYVRAKFAALASALFLLTALPVTILYVGALLGELDFADQTEGYALGLVSTAVLSLLLAGIGLVVAAATPRRGFGVAAVIALLTIPYGAVTTVQAIAWEEGSRDAVQWLGLFSPITLVDGISSSFLGGDSSFPGAQAPSTAAGAVYVLFVLALVAGSYGVLLRRYRKAGL